MVKTPKSEKLDIMVDGLAKRLGLLESALPNIETALGLVSGIGILAAIETTGSFLQREQKGIIKGKVPGGNGCDLVVTTSVTYVYDKPVGECIRYKVFVKTVVKENCPGTRITPMAPKTSTHETTKIFCGDEGDKTTKGITVRFDGVEIDTLTFEHGTKVKVERGKPSGKATVTLTYPDGESDSFIAPPKIA